MNYERKKYLEAARSQLKDNKYTFLHSLELEACMGGIYDWLKGQGQLGSDDPSRGDWTLAGLVHDIDYCEGYKEIHPAKTREVLAKYDLEISDAVDAIIKAHAPERTGVQPRNKAQWAIFCSDSLTGLINCVALIMPSKKMADVKLSSVVKRFLKDPKFAAGTRREEVAQCANPEGLNIPVEKFIEICLTSIQKIAPEIGL
jgi:predicted hydrolase (HD superfamily)